MSNTLSQFYPNVRIADGAEIGPFVVIGEPPRGAEAGELPAAIGRNALVGAGAVVTHDVPEGKVVAGNPACIIKDVAELSAYAQTELLGESK